MRGYESMLEVAKKTGKTGLVKTLFDSMAFKIPGCPFCHKAVRQNEVFCLAELFDTVFLAHVECIEKHNETESKDPVLDIAGPEPSDLNDLAQKVIDS